MRLLVAAGIFACLSLTISVQAQEMGRIKTVGSPGSAGVWVDGKYVGPSKRFSVAEKYDVAPGEHEITFREARYEDQTIKVTVQARKTTKVKFKLTKLETAKPPFGRLRFGGGVDESFMSVTFGDTSPVYLNGRFYGYVDELNNIGGGLLLNPGTYHLKVNSPIYGTIDQDVTIDANKVTVIPLNDKR